MPSLRTACLPSTLRTFLGAAALLALAGCGTSFDRTVTLSWPSGAPVVEGEALETTEQVFPHDGGPLAIDVTANKGPVEVRVDPGATTIRVLATVDVSGSVDGDSRQGVADAVSVWAHLEPPVQTGEAGAAGGPGSVLRVGAESSRPDADDHRVRLRIILPRADGALVRSTEGGVLLVGVAGAVQVETKSGFIEMRTAHVVDTPVNLSTESGNIFFQAPRGTSGRFDLRTNEGRATMSSHDPAMQAYATDTTYRGVLRDGVNPIVLTTGKGDVRAWVIERPEQLVRLFK